MGQAIRLPDLHTKRTMTDPSHYSGKLPEYVCHKTVRAAKIAHIRHIAKGAELDLTGPKGEDLGVFVVGLDFDLFTTMKPGWYLMRFDDGTVTAQGAKAFEKGYMLKCPLLKAQR